MKPALVDTLMYTWIYLVLLTINYYAAYLKSMHNNFFGRVYNRFDIIFMYRCEYTKDNAIIGRKRGGGSHTRSNSCLMAFYQSKKILNTSGSSGEGTFVGRVRVFFFPDISL